MKFTYHHTKVACYLSGFVQSIVINLPPLLFAFFHENFGIPLSRIGLLVMVNFGVQIATDVVALATVDRIGYRKAAVISQVFAVFGMISFALLPHVMTNAYWGLLIATCCIAIGGGLIEVVTSPLLHALPLKEKSSEMALLHSFYCWGYSVVVLLSAAYFAFVGIARWSVLVYLWTLVPLVTGLLFLKVPICPVVPEGKEAMRAGELFRNRFLWVLLLLMICAGASEQAMAQWASLFAEKGLKVNKAVGDLLGPCLFAVMMALARTYYGIRGAQLSLRRSLAISGFFCVIGFLITTLSGNPLLSLAGCAMIGISSGILWPGMLSFAAIRFPLGGTIMFGVMAFAGDVGCSVGPWLVGRVSDWRTLYPEGLLKGFFSGLPVMEAGLKTGLLFSVLFPVIFFGIFVWMYWRERAAKK